MRKKIDIGEVLEEEIKNLRELMQVVVAKQDESVGVRERNNLLTTLSRASASLGQLLKIQNELDQSKGGSVEMLEQALLELEEEWPEFKQLVAKYYPETKEMNEG